MSPNVSNRVCNGMTAWKVVGCKGEEELGGVMVGSASVWHQTYERLGGLVVNRTGFLDGDSSDEQ